MHRFFASAKVLHICYNYAPPNPTSHNTKHQPHTITHHASRNTHHDKATVSSHASRNTQYASRNTHHAI